MWTLSSVQMHPHSMIVVDEDATLELQVKTVKVRHDYGQNILTSKMLISRCSTSRVLSELLKVKASSKDFRVLPERTDDS
jgi:hypothetical protein